MTTDLSKLTTAAERWDGMAKEFYKQETAYRRDVHGISMGQTWTGLSADAANRRFDITLKEFQNAQVEAKAIASLLRDAHTQFVDLRKKLESARDEAVSKDMKVSDQGVVSYDTGRLSTSELSALHHDPDYQESVRKAVASWQQRIDQLVKDVGDADKGVEVAFNAVVIDSDTTDGTTNGFNGKAQGDIETYKQEAKRQETERKSEAKQKESKEGAGDETLKTIIRGIGRGAAAFSHQPGDLGAKFIGAVAEVTGYNQTQGITIGGSVGFVVGVSGSVSLVQTTTPDGRPQINFMYSYGETTAGWDVGASADIGFIKSNADDISQLKGAGWDTEASLHAGVGVYGGYQHAIGTVNSKGEPVGTASGGIGLGLGNEVATGFSNGDGWTLWERKKRR
ncbi:hypothetical protein [Streptomyces triticisoli]|uniref:hypothetical protein n=1 Tax=Streptomyces triticisoli TaxID=2182797 RepID=UPI0018E52E5E|nr:hypothetical protein [Streptomyces triticisoli]